MPVQAPDKANRLPCAFQSSGRQKWGRGELRAQTDRRSRSSATDAHANFLALSLRSNGRRPFGTLSQAANQQHERTPGSRAALQRSKGSGAKTIKHTLAIFKSQTGKISSIKDVERNRRRRSQSLLEVFLELKGKANEQFSWSATREDDNMPKQQELLRRMQKPAAGAEQLSGGRKRPAATSGPSGGKWTLGAQQLLGLLLVLLLCVWLPSATGAIELHRRVSSN